jgi:hypothetical protein
MRTSIPLASLSIALVLTPMLPQETWAQDTTGRLCFEAEDARALTLDFRVRGSRQDARGWPNAGTGYVEIPWNGVRHAHSRESHGLVVFVVNVPTNGNYQLWARTLWEEA